MGRILAIAIALGLALVALPPLWFAVAPPEPPPPLPEPDRRIPVGDGASVGAVVRGSGRPVVLVHGLPGTGHDWKPLTELLARRGHRVIAYDRLGYGHSDARPGEAFTADGNARDLLAVLEAEGLRDATVVGWSYGGAVAIRAARTDDSRIGRLVLIGSAGYWPEAPEPPALHAVLFSAPVMAWLNAVPPVGRRMQAGFSAEAFHPNEVPSWWPPQLAANFAAPHTQETWLEEGARMTWDEALDPAPVARPILVVHGDQDALVPLEVAEMLHERARASQLWVVEGGGHMLPITHADPVAKRVAGFALVR